MSPEEIKMPQLGESVTEGTVVKWFVKEGEQVEKYQPLAEIMTDKVTAEIPSTATGIVKKIMIAEDETVPVGTVLCLLEKTDEREEASLIEEPFSRNEQKKKTRYSPAVLKLSREYGIDLREVRGTGAGGRVTRKDVLNFIVEKNGLAGTSAHKTVHELMRDKKERKGKKDLPTSSGEKRTDTLLPVTGIRKAIAENMVRSYTEIPHAWMMVEADVTDLVAFRNSVKEEFKAKEGYHLTYFPFFIKAVAQALKEFPQLNATWNGNEIIQKKEINISVAVATEDALYVPVIRAADEKSIKGIARQLSEFVKKAKNATFSVEDMQGGTFTVNNTGTFGSVQSRGIINYPQAAILQVEKIIKRPVVINGMIAIRDIVNLCLSIDHRILDGLISGRFLQRVKEILENTFTDKSCLY